MTSRYSIEEARAKLGDLVTAARAGQTIIITRNGKPAAQLTQYPEETMDTIVYSPMDEEEAKDFCTTADEAKNNIRVAIEASGAANADDYDIDAIFDEAYEWEIDVNEQGQELLNSAGFKRIVDVDEFWEIVARHDRSV